MFRRSTNNPWVSPSGYANDAAFENLGGGSSGIINARFGGLLGQTMVLSNGDALKVSNTSVGTLYMGVYQLVKYASAVTTVSRGQLLLWDTLANSGLANFQVTTTAAATNPFKAGIALKAETAGGGKYAWIQVAGLATCLYRAAVTDATLGNYVVQTSLTTTTFDAIADAGTTFATNGGAKLFVGVAYELPANDGLKRVALNLSGFYPNIA